MSLAVIGAGFGRTGTLSLKLALEQLGFGPCYHMFEVGKHPEHVALWRDAAAGGAVDWAHLFQDYRSSVDWPACNYWESQLAAFPEARIILSQRDPELWYASVMNTIYPSSVRYRSQSRESGDAQALARANMVFEVIWDGVFDGRVEHKDHAIARYLAHADAVRQRAPADRLLTFDPAAGWEPLCAFLNCARPQEPFPKSNTTEQFLAR